MTVATVVSDMGMDNDNESVATGCQCKKISVATSNVAKEWGQARRCCNSG